MVKVYNEDSRECLNDIANECLNPVIVTDPPFNIGYHYSTYKDKVSEKEYLQMLSGIIFDYPTVLVLYPETLHKVSIAANQAPDRVVSWVYPSNTRRQHRDIGFYGIQPDFSRVRRPYKNPKDKRIIELQKRTGGAKSYDWIETNQVKNVSKEKTAHPCQMPLSVMKDVVAWLGEDITVIDPFMGSGTTVLACDLLGIEARGIDIDPEYCDIALSRLDRGY